MIPQLHGRMSAGGANANAMALTILQADPLDLVLHMEQVWDKARLPPGGGLPAGLSPVPQPPPPPAANEARPKLYQMGFFSNFAPLDGQVTWEHLGYSYVIENTRAVQIFRRVVREYRSGEGLGIPSLRTQRWLDATEALLFGWPNIGSIWLSGSNIRRDAEAIRRNAYWRLFGLDLAFGTDDNGAPAYDKAKVANIAFRQFFEELLFELWQAMSNERNFIGPNAADNDRIFRLSEELRFLLRSRRQNTSLRREELVAATVLGWIELTLSANTPVVVDMKAEAVSPADRLRIIGSRVGLPPHSKSAEFFALAAPLSYFLYFIERGFVSSPSSASLLYSSTIPLAIGGFSRRVITEWAAATGQDLKVRGKPVEVRSRPPAITAA